MITKYSQENLSETYIGVPAKSDIPTPPVGQLPPSYYYLSLLPAILTALTRLILELKKKDKDDEDKE